MANNNVAGGAPTVLQWFANPRPQYVPLADVAFGAHEPVLPHALPPSAAVFQNATFNKMLNIPAVQAIYDIGRTGRIF